MSSVATWHRDLRLIASCAAVLAMVACGGNASDQTGSAASSASGAPAPTTSSSPTPTTGGSSRKPTLIGLVTQGPGTTRTPPVNDFEELNAHPGVYSAAVVRLFWSQLEPTQGNFDDGAIDSALANLAAYNAKYPSTPVVAKLRVFMGIGTPEWVANATGPVTLTDSDGSTATFGEFWTTEYDALWQALQQHLAAKYDASPMIGEVAITSCSSLTGEPFILPQSPNSIATLHQAGYTDAQAMACLNNAPADYAAWKQTPLDYTFNAFTETDSGIGVVNTDFPIQVMTAFRGSLGTRAVVGNHGLQPTLASAATSIYAEFQTLESNATAAGSISPLEFQTYSPTVAWPTTITLALTYHPTEIEIWDTVAAGGSAPLTQQQLAGWAVAVAGQHQ